MHIQSGTRFTLGVVSDKVQESASRYHSPLRTRQAAETRRSIIDAALTLFGDHGVGGDTTLPMIAARARHVCRHHTPCSGRSRP